MSEFAIVITIYIVSVLVLLVGSFFVLREERNKNGYLDLDAFFWAFVVTFTPFVNTVIICVGLFVVIVLAIDSTKLWTRIRNHKFFEKK